nr:MAG TPA: hypothetical protein [Caudoviricetes sp.]
MVLSLKWFPFEFRCQFIIKFPVKVGYVVLE